MNYLYRRLAHNELEHYKRDGYAAVFMDVADFEQGDSPNLDKMISKLKEGDEVHFSTMADMGINAERILHAFSLLVEKKVSVSFLSESVNIEQSMMEECYRFLTSFHQAECCNQLGEREFQERKRVEQAQVAAKLSGQRLDKALTITREYLNGDVTPQDLATKYGVGLTTVYRYIKEYKSEVLKER